MAAKPQLVVTHDDETGDVLVGEAGEIQQTPVLSGHAENLALDMESGLLQDVGQYVNEKAKVDKSTRSEWEDQNTRSMKLLGIGPESEPSGLDYEDADTSDHPLLLSALVRFQSTAIAELLPPEKVCNGVSAFDLARLPIEARGDAERAIEKAIKRVSSYYLDYLGNKLPSYEEDTDLILRDCGLMGVGIRKVYVDPTIRSAPVRADYVPLEDLFIAYDAKSTKEGRVTHRMRVNTSDMVRYMTNGIYRVTDLKSDSSASTDGVTEQRDAIQGLSKQHLTANDHTELHETHANLFLENDMHPQGLSRPYIITVEVDSGEVLSVRRNWVEGDPEEKRIEHFVAYPYHPGKSSIFALGLGALLSNQTGALRSAQRAGLDAGYLANHPVGFKKSNMSIRNDNMRLMPGEFQDVDSPGAGPISDSLMLHPFKGPDVGLLGLMQHMEANGKELGGVATADLTGMMGPSVAPGPALAAYDEQTKFQSAVHRRLYRAHRTELRLIHQRMREIFGNRPVPYGANNSLEPQDLILVDLLPAMDPGQISRARRMMESQSKLDTAEKYPDVINKRAAVIDFLNAIGTSDIDHLLIPEPVQATPADAVTEFGNIIKGVPIVAGPAQNHMAHIDAHIANMKGLQGSQLPAEDGERIMIALSAHIAEHYAMDLAVQVAQAMNMPLEMFAEGIPPEIEVQIAPMITEAVRMVEELRAGPSDNDIKIKIEEMKAANRIQVEQIKQQTIMAKEAVQTSQNRDDNATSTLNNREDNATALLIAGLKGMAPPATDQNVTAPSNDQRPDPSRSARS